MYISERARKMEPSATLAVTAKAKSLKREGKPVISFGAGEPDFDSPPSAIRYAEEAMKGGQTHYTPGTGIPELREQVCAYYKNRFGLEYSPSDVVVGSGAKPLLYEALGCIIDAGDEVLGVGLALGVLQCRVGLAGLGRHRLRGPLGPRRLRPRRRRAAGVWSCLPTGSMLWRRPVGPRGLCRSGACGTR